MRADERAALRDLLVRGADGDRAALETAFARTRPLVIGLGVVGGAALALALGTVGGRVARGATA